MDGGCDRRRRGWRKASASTATYGRTPTSRRTSSASSTTSTSSCSTTAAGESTTSELELGQIRTNGARLFHIRDGNVTRLLVYFDRERALADLGLDPEDDAADLP
jgi:hypothetical protein